MGKRHFGTKKKIFYNYYTYDNSGVLFLSDTKKEDEVTKKEDEVTQ